MTADPHRPRPLPSRDHVEALDLAHRLERSDAASASADRRALLLYWYGAGATHLRAEEAVLLAAWERHGGRDHPLNASIRAEHARLGEEVAALAPDAHPPPDRLRRVGRALALHVRRQEHELTGVVEHAVPAEELATVHESLDELRHS